MLRIAWGSNIRIFLTTEAHHPLCNYESSTRRIQLLQSKIITTRSCSHMQTQPRTFFQTVTQVVQPPIIRAGLATDD